MSLTVDQIVEETKGMPRETVLQLVERILAECDPAESPAFLQYWEAEITRRVEDLRSGKVKGIPLEEALSLVRKSANL